MGDPAVAIIGAAFGCLPFLVLVRGLWRMLSPGFDPSFSDLSFTRRVALLFSIFVLLVLVVVPSAWFFWVCVSEFTFEASCKGGSCAQGGVGIYLAAVVGGAIVPLLLITAGVLKKIGALPTRAEIDLAVMFPTTRTK